MKKYISVLGLIARESIFKIFLVFIPAFFLQAVLFYFCIGTAAAAYVPTVPLVFDISNIHLVFFALVVVLAVLLCKTGMQLRSSVGYTLRRLRIREESVFLIQSLYNFLIIAIAVMLEVCLCFYLSCLASDLLPEEFITTQSVYLSFYKTTFVQQLFAGRDILRIVRNVIAVLSFSVNCAAFSFMHRRGKKWFGAVIVLPVMFRMLGNQNVYLTNIASDVLIIAAMLILLALAVAVVLMGRDKDEI